MQKIHKNRHKQKNSSQRISYKQQKKKKKFHKNDQLQTINNSQVTGHKQKVIHNNYITEEDVNDG